MKSMEKFAPMQRKPSRSGKSIILKKSRKELQTTQAHMQKVNIALMDNISCDVMDERGNFGSRPIKKFPSGNVKRSWTTMVGKASSLKKDIGALRPTQLKAMAELVRKENNVKGSSKLKGRSSHNQEGFSCSSKLKDRLNHNKGHVSCAIEDRSKKLNRTNGKEFSPRMFGKDLSNNPRDNTSSMDVDKHGSFGWIDQRELIKETNYKLDYIGQVAKCYGETKNRKRRIESLLDGKAKSHAIEHSEEVVEVSNQTFREIKKPRRKVIFEEDEDEAIEDDITRLFKADAVEYSTKVSIPLCVEQLSYCCSKPIDEPTWRGILKIGQKYVSLAGHLSTKYGEKVWKLSRSLMPIVEVTKISRSKAWPKVWEVSEPNGDNIGLYFFPNEMRPNEGLYQLIKEVMENDLVLQAVIGEAEMLIFPSILLPEQYKSRSRKHEDVAAAKPLDVIGCCAHEVRLKTQHFSTHQDEVQREQQDQETTGMKSAISFESQDLPGNKTTDEAQATSVQGTPNKGFDPKVLEGRQGVALDRGMTGEAMESAINGGTLPANHGEIDQGRRLPSGKVFGFVVGHTPRLLQLIREVEHEGGVVIAMQGETIG
ncbi:hypothetical protein EJB05_02371 [Eragrostis curvula]|uniref:AIPP2-like SPOC-like domain-containing protein n=1 Tax=Eragrostis curvula TaxID=38414 RepID=A0A5J9WQD5_9POAL|nr:hypothetical protein EJB05_02371 [Eragrostis curvula]